MKARPRPDSASAPWAPPAAVLHAAVYPIDDREGRRPHSQCSLDGGIHADSQIGGLRRRQSLCSVADRVALRGAARDRRHRDGAVSGLHRHSDGSRVAAREGDSREDDLSRRGAPIWIPKPVSRYQSAGLAALDAGMWHARDAPSSITTGMLDRTISAPSR